MPPGLHKGIPVRTRRYVVPSAVVLCECSECILYNHFDLKTNSIVSGQNIPYSLYRRHLREDRSRMTIARHFARQGSASAPTPEPYRSATGRQDVAPSIHYATPSSQPSTDMKAAGSPCAPSLPRSSTPSSSTPPSPPRRRATRSVHTTRTHPKHEQSFLVNVKHYLETLSSESFREGVFQKKLDFIFPPDQHLGGVELHPEVFDLAPESDSPRNYALLQHERTLHGFVRIMEDILRQKRASRIEKARIRLLLPLVKQEIEESFAIRKECWTRMWEQSRMLDETVKVQTGKMLFSADISLNDASSLHSRIFLLFTANHGTYHHTRFNHYCRPSSFFECLPCRSPSVYPSIPTLACTNGCRWLEGPSNAEDPIIDPI